MGRVAFEERREWQWWVTPKPLAAKPIHRWYVFPHSFTSELVHALIEEWHLTPEATILDPFVGAGTTLLAAKEKGIPAAGYDLSPLAVLATQVKIADYDTDRLRGLWSRLCAGIHASRCDGTSRAYPDFVRTALPAKILGAFDAMDRAIAALDATSAERHFFKLALLSTMRQHSRAMANGGWPRWVDRRSSPRRVIADFSQRVNLMIADLERASAHPRRRSYWRVGRADARLLPDAPAVYSAVITSPPYPNRHDYTRVFGVELMFAFLDWEQTRQLRYQSFHSHPEARPVRPEATGYVEPRGVARAIALIRRREKDLRVTRMIEGYFLDLYLSLRELRRVCKRGARVALVVGNAQYRGIPLAVDKLAGEVGEQAGLTCERLLVARYRGNSAQQMGRYGRRPSRESVVVFRNL